MAEKQKMGSTQIYRPHDGFQRNFVRTNVSVCFGGGILGGGKMNPLYSKILTPDGFIEMRDVNEGTIVNTPFGGTSKVIKIFDHKNKDIYQITTVDGRKAYCGLEHLWYVRTFWQVRMFNKNKDYSRNYSILKTQEIIEKIQTGIKLYLPIPQKQELTKQDLPIPPYLLGVLLGDGCLTPKAWKQDTHILFSNTEEDIIQRIYELAEGTKIYRKERLVKIYTPNGKLYRDYCIRNGLCTYSYDKFIPKEYLHSSIEDRMELLRGMMDTDGTVDKKGRKSYCTTSEKLKDCFVFLCRSLGLQVRVFHDEKSSVKLGGAWRIGIITDEVIVHSKKHKEKYKKYLEKSVSFHSTKDHVRILSIEKVDVSDARCIYIDDPLHLYIVDDFLPTHNTFGAVLATAEPALDPNWRGLFLRNNLDDAKSAGGLLDTFKEAYGNSIQIRTADMPRVVFPSGAYVDVTHVADQSIETILRRFKGRQYDMIYFDELSNFTWDCFKTILSRNRGKSAYAGKCIATTNPERECWIRPFIDWYIDDEGFVMEERSGVVRYFYMMGSDVKDVVWADTPEEVYNLCKSDIDKKLDKVYGFMKGRDKWPAMIKSFTFYLGKMSENKEMLENNEGYLGSIAMSGGAEAAKLLEGNWNVSSRDEEGTVISFDEANSVFTNDPQVNGDKWITVDLADSGTNNFVQVVWDGLHVIDIDIAPYTTPAENANRMKSMANKHNIGYRHIIYDAIRGRYINDYIHEAVPFESYRAPIGVNALQYVKLKDCCYGKLVWLIKNNDISVSDDVASRRYINVAEKTKSDITVQNEFIEEARVIRWADAPNGKKRLLTKKEMNRMLGRGRSMDLIDPFCMRMYPLLNSPDGYELENSRVEHEQYRDDEENGGRVDIYDETTWY